MILLVDDLDDLARARLNDHPAVIDHRVAKSGVTGTGPSSTLGGTSTGTTPGENWNGAT
jgi:hypothetical protein